MSVGFSVPQGSKSLANTDPPLQTMDLTAHPWDFPSATQEFITAHNRRYGTPRPGNLMADVPGMHATTTIPVWLSEIAAANPGWFEANGLGRATGSLTPSQEEIHDAQAAFVPGRGRVSDLLAEEHSRLFPGGDLVKPGGPTKPEPPKPDPEAAQAKLAAIGKAVDDAIVKARSFKRPGGKPLRALDDLVDTVLRILAVLVLAVSLSGCGSSGILLELFTGVTSADAQFDGPKSGPVRSLTAAYLEDVDPKAALIARTAFEALGQKDPAGWLMPVSVVGEASPRLIKCTGDHQDKCAAIPINALVHYAGSPDGRYWRIKRLTADNFND